MSKAKRPVGRPRTTVDDLPACAGIYALHCPKSGRIMYIGQSKSIRERVASHLRASGKITPSVLWVRRLKKDGLKPFASVLELTEDLNNAEIRHIRDHGIDGLLNVHHGGEWEGREDPKPWRVIGVSYPSKLYTMRCRNIGVSQDMITAVQRAAKSHKTNADRMRFELMVASILCDSDLCDKIKKWFSVVLPRIERDYPEILNG